MSSGLTALEQQFLLQHGIPSSRIYDVGGGSPRSAAIGAAMEQLGKSFAFNATPCKKGGHRLRTRAGHCIQCDHSKIAYQMRYDDSGVVYLAASRSGTFVKVGTTQDPEQRMNSLRTLRYGGVSDWRIEFQSFTDRAGAVEFAVHQSLKRYNVEAEYIRAGVSVACKELFSCSTTVALKALKAALQPK